MGSRARRSGIGSAYLTTIVKSELIEMKRLTYVGKAARHVLRQHGRMLALALLCLVAGMAMFRPVIELPFQIAKDYNEGWNAYQAAHALSGDKLYPGYKELTGNNYPPVSYYVVGAVGQITGDNIIAGRVIALLSLLGAAVAAGAIVRLLTGSWYGAIAAGLFLMGYMAARHSLYVAQNDPQWLGHACMIAGALLLLRSRQHGTLFYCAVLVVVVGGFIKQILIPLPFAATLWLLIFHKDVFRRWLVVSILLVGIGLTILTVLHGEEFLRQLFLDPRVYSRSRMASSIDEWFTPMLPLIVLGALATPLLRRSKEGVFVLIYVVISVLWAVFLLGGRDVGENAVFDVILALTLVVGILIGRVHSMKWAPLNEEQPISALLVLCLVLTIGVVSPKRFYETRETVKILETSKVHSGEDVSFIAAHPGPAMCENLALCYWAKKRFEVDLFLTGQKIETGVFSEKKLTDLIDRGYFAVVQLDDQTGTTFRLPGNVVAHIRERYDLRRISKTGGSFFVPRANSLH
jgi:hypothetical protein